MKSFRWRKLLVGVLLVLLVLVGGGLAGAHYVLSSAYATRKVKAKLEAMLGERVDIDHVHIGLTGDSTLYGVKIYEHPASEGEPGRPWFTADEVQANLSALGLMHEAELSELRLRGAAVTLRFDKGNRLLTRLPHTKGKAKKLPRVDVDSGTLTLEQQDHPPLVIHGLKGSSVPEESTLVISATASDPVWADWTLHATIGTATDMLSATAETQRAEVTMAKLRALPFIPAKVWKEVEAEGTTPVRLTLHHAPGKEGTHYELRLEPTDTRVYIPAIKLRADKAHGTILIDDKRVRLTGVEGHLVNPEGHSTPGIIETASDMDFAGKTDVLRFDVKLNGIVLHDLPKNWSRPDVIDGNLTGHAKLLITVGDKVHTSGEGQGVVDPAFVLGFRADPVYLKLVSSEKGFEFNEFKQGASPPAPAGGKTSRLPLGLLRTVCVLIGPSLGDEPPPAPKDAKTPPSPASPIHWIGKVPDLAHQAAQTAAGAAHAVLHPVTRVMHRAAGSKLPVPAKPANYLEATLGLEDVDLAELVRRVKLKLPGALTGRLTFHVKLSIPYDRPDDVRAYRVNGTAELPRLNVAGVDFANVKTGVRFVDGVLALDDLRGQAPRPGAPAGTVAGTFKGNLRYQVAPAGDLDVNVAVDRVPLDLALAQLPGPARDAKGILSGTLKVHGPGATLRDLATWTGTATLRSDSLQVYGVTVTNAAADLSLDKGVARLTSLKGDLEGTPVNGSGEVGLKDAHPFKIKLTAKGTDMAAVKRLAPSLRPPVSVEGRLTLGAEARGTLSPRKFTLAGSVSAADLIVGGVKFDSLSFDWSGNEEAVKLSALKAHLYKGDLTGTVTVPLKETAVGSADLRVKDVDAEALTKGFKAIPVRIQGQVSGTLKGTIGPAKPGAGRALTSDATLTAPRLRVQGIPADSVHASFNYRAGAGSYRLQGDSLGGKFKLEGKLPPKPRAEEAPGESRAPDGRLEIDGMRLSLLYEAVRRERGTSPIGGIVYVNLPFRLEGPNWIPVGRGSFQLDALTWGGVELTDLIEGELLLNRGLLELRDVEAIIGGGMLRARAVVNLRQEARSWLSLQLDHVDSARLLAPFPTAAKLVEGIISAQLRVRLDGEWHGSGDVGLTRGKVLGIEVTEWRFPLNFTFSPRVGDGTLHVHDSHADLAGGRANAQADLSWGAGVRLAGTVRIFDARMQTLLRSAGSLASYAGGRLTARIDLGGSEMRSINDLTANVVASFREAQAMQLPVLQQLIPFILPGGASSTTFQSGSLKGRLAGGIFRVQSFTLTGSYLQLFIRGNVTLQGRLDLEAYARTGGNVNRAGCLGFLGVAALPTGALPVLLVVRASTFLANQVLSFHIGGTIRSPSIRFQPVRLLAEEAIRFFLTGATFPVP